MQWGQWYVQPVRRRSNSLHLRTLRQHSPTGELHYHRMTWSVLAAASVPVVVVLEVNLNVMHYINSFFTFLLTLLTYLLIYFSTSVSVCLSVCLFLCLSLRWLDCWISCAWSLVQLCRGIGHRSRRSRFVFGADLEFLWIRDHCAWFFLLVVSL